MQKNEKIIPVPQRKPDGNRGNKSSAEKVSPKTEKKRIKILQIMFTSFLRSYRRALLFRKNGHMKILVREFTRLAVNQETFLFCFHNLWSYVSFYFH